MWISQATLDGLQADVVERGKQMEAAAQARCDQLRAILALLVDDARFQALPARHPFRSELCLAPALAKHSQGASAVLDWIVLLGATKALLQQEVASSWLRRNRPDVLTATRELMAQQNAS